MSAMFKNAKKKLVQSEFRKLKNEHKNKSKDVKKIESPLAKYNEAGQLTCILCKSIVKSENVWAVHLNSKQHRENVDAAKKLKERTHNFTIPAKRALSPPKTNVPEKKVKSILKNSKSNGKPTETTTIPKDFFDSKQTKPSSSFSRVNGNQEQMEVDEAPKEPAEVLPEGFFDDPKLDAKARNQEYKDPVEEEWDKFQKAIREADDKSNAIISEDQDESTNERQILEIDEQIKHLSKVLLLEKKKASMTSSISEVTQVEMEEDSDLDENEDFEEFLDWRCKRAYK